jgi:hypothetical protein
MSTRVDFTPIPNTSLTCPISTDVADGSAQAPPESAGPVCTAEPPEAPDPAAGLNSTIGQAQLRTNTIDGLKAQAKAAGLNQAETDALGDTLNKYHSRDFNREVDLVRSALASDNPARAARTYLDLAPQRSAHPDRITPDVARALVMGVGTSATDSPTGHKGVIGRAQANQAADALTKMLPGDYSAIQSSLSKAGQTDWSGASPDAERALILKGVAARKTQFPPTTPSNLVKYGVHPSFPAKAVTDFAGKIHDQHRAFMVSNTEVLGLNNPNQALEQRWNDSCGPTTIEMTQADNDSVYSYNVNSTELAHDTKSGLLSTDQALTLMFNSGIPRPRGTPGQGMTLEHALNVAASPVTDRTYSTQAVPNTPAGRTAALNQMEKLLDQGVDVPIRVQWPNGGGHFQLCSDVQGTAPNRQFMISDPWTGHSEWLNESSIANGNTDFLAGKGNLAHIYPSTPNP